MLKHFEIRFEYKELNGSTCLPYTTTAHQSTPGMALFEAVGQLSNREHETLLKVEIKEVPAPLALFSEGQRVSHKFPNSPHILIGKITNVYGDGRYNIEGDPKSDGSAFDFACGVPEDEIREVA